MIGELSPEQIEQVLLHEVVGRIGCHAEGKVYVVPISYAYRDGAVYGHSLEGRKVQMMRKNAAVCFEVDHMQDLGTWQSVIAQARYEELTGPQAVDAMHVLTARMAPLITSPANTPTHGKMSGAAHAPNAVVFRLVLQERTGRFEKQA
jgi:nitroimidazol reductase NimA-like FMN-containing flavoprotein (pyridoxamine 5'-phosphate oxidase superfamily)